jgi:hypothetical protein
LTARQGKYEITSLSFSCYLTCTQFIGSKIQSETKTKQVFLGNLNPGAYFNEGAAIDSKSYEGCPFTVIALQGDTNNNGNSGSSTSNNSGLGSCHDDEDGEVVQCATISAVGDWRHLDVTLTASRFAKMSQNEILRLQAMEERKR